MNTSVLHVPLAILITVVGNEAASVTLSRASFFHFFLTDRITIQLSNTKNEAQTPLKLDIIVISWLQRRTMREILNDTPVPS